MDDVDPRAAKRTRFRAAASLKGIAASVQAVVGWAIAVEAFTNFAWNVSIAGEDPSKKLSNAKYGRLNTIEKIDVMLKRGSVNKKDASWLSGLRDLLDLRNRLLHYEEDLQYIGFEFAPPYFREFEERGLAKFRSAIGDAITCLGSLAELPTDFLNGKCEAWYLDE